MSDIVQIILSSVLPILTGFLGYYLAIKKEEKTFQRILKTKEKEQQNKKMFLFRKAFIELYDGLINIMGMIKFLEKIGDHYRLKHKPLLLKNKYLIDLENCEFLDDKEFYFISDLHIITKKIEHINDFLGRIWSDPENSIKSIIKYLEDEKVFFVTYSLALGKFLNIDFDKFKKTVIK